MFIRNELDQDGTKLRFPLFVSQSDVAEIDFEMDDVLADGVEFDLDLQQFSIDMPAGWKTFNTRLLALSERYRLLYVGYSSRRRRV